MSDSDREIVAMFMEALAMSEATATALVANGIITIEEVAYIPNDELAKALILEGASPALLRESTGIFIETRYARSTAWSLTGLLLSAQQSLPPDGLWPPVKRGVSHLLWRRNERPT